MVKDANARARNVNVNKKEKKMKLSRIFMISFLLVSLVVTLAFVLAGVPEQLFDITMNIEDRTIESSDELVAIITYESFGSVPTPVDLTYTIYNKDGEIVHAEKGDVIVETENIERKYFKGLNLPEGEYYLIFETIYNVDVSDEFRGDFEIKKEKTESSLLWLWIIIGMGLVVFVLVIVYFLRRKKK